MRREPHDELERLLTDALDASSPIYVGPDMDMIREDASKYERTTLLAVLDDRDSTAKRLAQALEILAANPPRGRGDTEPT